MRLGSSFARFVPLRKETPDLSSLLTHSRWICGIATVGTVNVSLLSGWGLADEGFPLITFLVIPLKVWIKGSRLTAVFFVIVVVRLT